MGDLIDIQARPCWYPDMPRLGTLGAGPALGASIAGVGISEHVTTLVKRWWSRARSVGRRLQAMLHGLRVPGSRLPCRDWHVHSR